MRACHYRQKSTINNHHAFLYSCRISGNNFVKSFFRQVEQGTMFDTQELTILKKLVTINIVNGALISQKDNVNIRSPIYIEYTKAVIKTKAWIKSMLNETNIILCCTPHQMDARTNRMYAYLSLIIINKNIQNGLTFLGSLMIHEGGIMISAWLPRLHCSSICCIMKHAILLW